MNAKEAAIAFALSSYRFTPPDPSPKQSKGNAKEKKVKASALPNQSAEVKATIETKDHSTPTNNRPVMPRLSLPPVGTLDARGFLLSWRKAHSRDEQIIALASYTGFNHSEPLGTQEFQARMKAQREIRGPIDISGPSRSEIRSLKNSVAGYVAGMPDHTSKAKGNLMARETLALDSMAEYLRQSKDSSLTQSERTLNEGLAALERERFDSISEELASIV